MKPHWFSSLASKRAIFICNCLFFKTLAEGKSIANRDEETCENVHTRSAFVGFWKAVFNSWYNRIVTFYEDFDEKFVCWKVTR